MRKITAILLVAILLLGLASCTQTPDNNTQAPQSATPPANNQNDNQSTGSEEPVEVKGTGVPIVVYTNSGSGGRGDWLVERAKQDGFEISYIEAGAGEIQNRLLAEAASPIADVVFGLSAIVWEDLKANDILIPYTPVWADEVSAGLNDPEGYYHAIVKQAILLTYDVNKLPNPPSDWLDLWTKPEFYGKYETQIALTGGTTRTVIAGVLSRFADPNGDLGISDEGWEQMKLYYEHGTLAESGVDLYAKFADPNSPVAAGQIWSSGIEDRETQYEVESAYVVPAVGIPYAVEAVAVVNGTKNLEEVQRFIDWFGSATVQGDWSEAWSTLPANELAVPRANDFNKVIATLPAQEIDWSLVAANIGAWCEKIELQYMP